VRQAFECGSKDYLFFMYIERLPIKDLYYQSLHTTFLCSSYCIDKGLKCSVCKEVLCQPRHVAHFLSEEYATPIAGYYYFTHTGCKPVLNASPPV
jgi:hypothetical protein